MRSNQRPSKYHKKLARAFRRVLTISVRTHMPAVAALELLLASPVVRTALIRRLIETCVVLVVCLRRVALGWHGFFSVYTDAHESGNLAHHSAPHSAARISRRIAPSRPKHSRTTQSHAVFSTDRQRNKKPPAVTPFTKLPSGNTIINRPLAEHGAQVFADEQ